MSEEHAPAARFPQVFWTKLRINAKQSYSSICLMCGSTAITTKEKRRLFLQDTVYLCKQKQRLVEQFPMILAFKLEPLKILQQRYSMDSSIKFNIVDLSQPIINGSFWHWWPWVKGKQVRSNWEGFRLLRLNAWEFWEISLELCLKLKKVNHKI